MKTMLCAALVAVFAMAAVPAFAAGAWDRNGADGVQRYTCCGSRYYSDEDSRGVYCDENGHCTYRRR